MDSSLLGGNGFPAAEHDLCSTRVAGNGTVSAALAYFFHRPIGRNDKRMRTGVIFAMALMVASRCLAENRDCNGPRTPTTFHLQGGDHADSKSLDASRSFTGAKVLEVDMCRGELRIKGTESSSLRLEIADSDADRDLSTYVHTFSVEGDTAKIDVSVPDKSHSVITLFVPGGSSLHSEVNVGAGNLFFSGNRVPGQRELNMGAGKVTMYLDGDRDYASLEANIGVGSLHDKRPGGKSAHFIAARTMQGSGSGGIKINVGAGSVDLEAAK